MIKVVGVIRPKETREIEAEAESYADAYNAVQKLVPEGWSLQSVRTDS